MKIVFNSHYSDAPATTFYCQGFKKINDKIVINDWINYKVYDIALFMSYPKDLDAIKYAKLKNPEIKIGLIDPRNSAIKKYIKYIDFFIVDSLEMYDFFCRYQKPIFKYIEFPDFRSVKKSHTKKNRIIIAYHGNKVHIVSAYSSALQAIRLLSDKYNIELWLIYNIKKLRLLDYALPKNVKVKHIQWSKKVYQDILSKADIGIAPALMPIFKIKRIKKLAGVFKYFFGENNDDYLIRYKMPTNAGRIIVFAKLGIPVVADFYPSAMQLIEHNKTGLLAYSIGGWYTALESLIKKDKLRQTLSDNLKQKIKQFDYITQNKELLYFLEREILSKKSSNKLILPEYEDYSMYLRINSILDWLKNKLFYLKKHICSKL